MADNHEDKRIVSFETEFDRELATNSNNKKQQVMKTKLSVLLLYLCTSHCSPHAATTGKNKKHLPENVANSYPELLETEVSGRNDPEIRKRD